MDAHELPPVTSLIRRPVRSKAKVSNEIGAAGRELRPIIPTSREKIGSGWGGGRALRLTSDQFFRPEAGSEIPQRANPSLLKFVKLHPSLPLPPPIIRFPFDSNDFLSYSFVLRLFLSFERIKIVEKGDGKWRWWWWWVFFLFFLEGNWREFSSSVSFACETKNVLRTNGWNVAFKGNRGSFWRARR